MKRLGWRGAGAAGWLALAVLSGCGGARNPEEPYVPPTNGPLTLPAGPWSEARQAAPAAGVRVRVPDANGNWVAAPDGTVVTLYRRSAPEVVLASGSTQGGTWLPPASAPAPAADLRVAVSVADTGGSITTLRGLYAQPATALDAGSEALVDWLEPQLADAAVAARLSAAEAAALQEMATIAADACLHANASAAGAVAVAKDLLANLSRLPAFATRALQEGADAPADLDWLDLLANRDNDRFGLSVKTGPDLDKARAGVPGAQQNDLLTLTAIRRDLDGERLLGADAMSQAKGSSVPGFLQRNGAGLYWQDSALATFAAGKLEALMYQLADRVPVLAYPLSRQGPLWSGSADLSDIGLDLDGDGQHEGGHAEMFLDAVGVEDHVQGTRRMRALHLRRNVVLSIPLTQQQGGAAAIGLRVDAWHVPGVGLVSMARQLVLLNGAAGLVQQTVAAADEMIGGRTNGYDLTNSQRLLAPGPVAEALHADPRGDRALVQQLPTAEGTPLVAVAQGPLGTVKLPSGFTVPTGFTPQGFEVGNDGVGLFARIAYTNEGAGHAAVWRYDVASGQRATLGEAPRVTYRDPVTGERFDKVDPVFSALAPEAGASAVTLSGPAAQPYLSLVGRTQADKPAVAPLLAADPTAGGLFVDPLAAPLRRDTRAAPLARVTANGQLVFDVATFGSGTRQQRIFRWPLDGSLLQAEPLLTGWRLVGVDGSTLAVQQLENDLLGRRLALVSTAGDTLASQDLGTLYPDLYGEMQCMSLPWAPLFCHAPSTRGGRRMLWFAQGSLTPQRSAIVRTIVDGAPSLMPLRDGSVLVLDPQGFGGDTPKRTGLWRDDPRLYPGE